MEKLKMQTLDGVQNNIEKIAALFPDCLTERKNEKGETEAAIDFDKLRQELSKVVVEGREERYQFTWPDKKKAILMANAPIRATLRPCKEESVDFEQTQNLYIEGDNLDVLKCLKQTYFGKVKMIYLDPPYNTGNDFVFEDDFAETAEDYMAHSGQYDEQGNRLVANSDNNGRYHTDWLNMIYPRLKVARDFLTDDGVIFISIDDHEVENLKKICNEIFGESNFIACVSWLRNYSSANDAKKFSNVIDYILVYSKSINYKRNLLPRTEKQNILYKYDSNDGKGRWRSDNLSVRTYSSAYDYPIENPNTKSVYNPPKGRSWITNNKTMDKWISENRVFFGQDGKGAPQLKRYLTEVQDGIVPTTFWSYEDCGHNDEARKEIKNLFENPPFDSPKPIRLLKQIIRIGSDKDSLILDFFSGSATTAHAVMQLNAEDQGHRKFILVQLPELTDEKSEAYKAGYPNICEIGKERIRRAGKKIKEELDAKQKEGDLFNKEDKDFKLDTGFRVLKLDSSNMEDVYYAPADYQKDQIEKLFTENIKPDRTAEDLLFQVMLELGATPDSKIESTEVAGKKIYNVDENYLVACFDAQIDDAVVTAIAKMQPQYAVFRDSSLADDSTATNFEQLFKTYSPNTTTKIL